MTAESQRVPAIFVFLLAAANLVIRSEIDARSPSLSPSTWCLTHLADTKPRPVQWRESCP